MAAIICCFHRATTNMASLGSRELFLFDILSFPQSSINQTESKLNKCAVILKNKRLLAQLAEFIIFRRWDWSFVWVVIPKQKRPDILCIINLFSALWCVVNYCKERFYCCVTATSRIEKVINQANCQFQALKHLSCFNNTRWKNVKI